MLSLQFHCFLSYTPGCFYHQGPYRLGEGYCCLPTQWRWRTYVVSLLCSSTRCSGFQSHALFYISIALFWRSKRFCSYDQYKFVLVFSVFFFGFFFGVFFFFFGIQTTTVCVLSLTVSLASMDSFLLPHAVLQLQLSSFRCVWMVKFAFGMYSGQRRCRCVNIT